MNKVLLATLLIFRLPGCALQREKVERAIAENNAFLLASLRKKRAQPSLPL